MKANHTMGPWEIPDDRPISHGYIKSKLMESVVCVVEPDLHHAGEQRGNMRLISTAPDLLRACIVAMDWLADKGMDPDHIEMRRIRTAIAKATGVK